MYLEHSRFSCNWSFKDELFKASKLKVFKFKMLISFETFCVCKHILVFENIK